MAGPYSENDVNKWLKNMLATPAAERTGQQDPTAVINKPTTAPSAASTTMPPTSLSSAPMGAAQEQFNQDVLNKRKDLASTLKQFARGEVQVDPEQMVKDASTVGVSREQLSGLYKQYRKEFKSSPESGPATPNLDRLAQMQNKPIGSSSALTRYDKNTGQPIRGVQGAVGGLETRPSGTQIGGRRSSLPKEMQNIAAANLYRAEQELLLQNEQAILDREEQRAKTDAFLRMNKPPEDGETRQMPYFIK